MKRVLLDENMPRGLARDLDDFEVRTVQEEGWSGLTNGILLRSAAGSFDVLVTADRRLQHQQNIASKGIAVVVVAARSTRLADIRELLEALKRAIREAEPGASIRGLTGRLQLTLSACCFLSSTVQFCVAGSAAEAPVR